MSPKGKLVDTINEKAISRNEETTTFQSKILNPPSKKRLSIEDFHIERELGRGAFGKVVLAKSKKTQKTYALKVLDKFFMEKLNKANEAFAERELLTAMKSPNIIKLFSAFQSSTKLFYVLEYCNNGNLKEYLEKNGQSFSFKQAQFYAAEIINVLKYFETKNIAHRDIKPSNIVLDENSHLKFIDFGTATIIGKRFSMKERKFISSDSSNIKELVGTAEYASPEMLNHCAVNEKSCDLWALGCILYQFFHERTPFKGFNEKETLEKIKLGHYSIRDDIPPQAKCLIQSLLKPNPNDRIGMISIDEIKSHSFFSEINFEELHNTPVPKISKSKSLFCINNENKMQKELDNSDTEDMSNYMINSLYSKNEMNNNTIISSSSTVYSSRNSQYEESTEMEINEH